MQGSFNDYLNWSLKEIIVWWSKETSSDRIKPEPGLLIGFKVKKTVVEMFFLRFNSQKLKFVQMLLDQQ